MPLSMVDCTFGQITRQARPLLQVIYTEAISCNKGLFSATEERIEGGCHTEESKEIALVEEGIEKTSQRVMSETQHELELVEIDDK